MNGNEELLNFVYQNAQMGVQTVEQIIEIAEGERFQAQLSAELKDYKKISEEAKAHLNRHGGAEKDISAMQKLSAYLMINIKTLTDQSPSHIAEMLIIGSSRGVVDAIKNIRKYDGAEEDILKLMKELLAMEENNIERLKAFL